MSCGMTHPFVLTNNKSWDCIEARVTYMRTQFMLAKKMPTPHNTTPRHSNTALLHT